MRAVDPYWNLIDTNAVLLDISSTDEFVVLSDSLQLVNGIVELTVPPPVLSWLDFVWR
ncbi:hypothetical protein MJD09_20425 [bacterium]|nr:hypothetical protein [bacterium]